MKMYTEKSLSSFEPWSGAVDRFNVLTMKQLDALENILEELYPDGMSETEINDFLWFEEDLIAEWLGYESFEELEKANKEEE